MSHDTEMSWPETTISTATVGMIAQMLGSESVLTSRADRITRRLERAIAVGILEHGDKRLFIVEGVEPVVGGRWRGGVEVFR